MAVTGQAFRSSGHPRHERDHLTELKVASGHHVAHSPLTEDVLDPEFPGYDVTRANTGHGAKCARPAEDVLERSETGIRFGQGDRREGLHLLAGTVSSRFPPTFIPGTLWGRRPLAACSSPRQLRWGAQL